MTKTLLSRLLEELHRLPLAPRLFQFEESLLESLRQVAARNSAAKMKSLPTCSRPPWRSAVQTKRAFRYGKASRRASKR